ncbi:SBH1 [Sanghuangporus vaninii]
MSDSSRASSPAARTTPHGTAVRRRAASSQVAKPNSTRAAGAGGSSSTMLRLYTDDSPGLRVDPFVVLMLSVVFIGSVVFLHIAARIIKSFSN